MKPLKTPPVKGNLTDPASLFRLTSMVILSIFFTPSLQAQQLSLQECYEKAMTNSPLLANQDYLKQLTQLREENLATQHLPQLNLNGQLTWQSDVITFPPLGSGMEFPTLPHTQYRVNLDVQQLIFDGGRIRYAKALNQQSNRVQQQVIQVDLNQLKPRINQLYFGILLKQKQREILLSSLETLQERRIPIVSAVENGAVLSSELDAFDKQVLSLRQQIQQTESETTALLNVLAVWTGESNINITGLSLPDLALPQRQESYDDLAEYKLFDLQREQFSLNQQLVECNRMPKIAAFAMGGLGQPNPFNFLETDISPFFQVGVRASWTVWDWGNNQREREHLTIQSSMVDTRKNQLDQAISAQFEQARENYESLNELLEQDDEIILLQEKIVNQASSQLEHGVITSADYVREINAQTQAKLQKELHRIQRVQTLVQIATLIGKF